MKFLNYDKELSKIETPQGTLSLATIFIPFFIEMILTNLMGTVNTLVLGHYADDAVAAVGAANQLMGMVFTFYTVISTGASIIMNQKLGAKNKQGASDAAFTSILFGFSLSMIVGVLLALIATPLLSLMHLKGQVLTDAVNYFKICITFSFMQALISSISAIFRSYGLPKTAVKVSLFMNAINVILNYIVIFRPFETPLYGVTGIAITNVISHALALILILYLLLHNKLDLQLKAKNIKSLKAIREILRVGVPGGVSSLSYSTSQVVSTSIIAIVGVTAISGKIYLSTIFFYVYVIGFALGQATALITGWLVGAGKYDQADRLNRQNLKITIAINFSLSVLIFIFGNQLIRLFTSNPEIIAMARMIMLIDIFVEIGRGFNHIEESSLRASGDVVFPMIVNIVSCWTMSILFSYILGIRFGLGLNGCWIAFAMDELFRGTLQFYRWKSKKWMSKTQGKLSVVK